jgi:hypothetical protein
LIDRITDLPLIEKDLQELTKNDRLFLLIKKKAIMNTPNKSYQNKLPEWQSAKMKTLIEERWSEIWEVVMARERSTQNASQHSSRSRY